MKKKVIITVLCVFVLALLLTTLCACNKDGASGTAVDTLKIYNWEDYIDESIKKDFADYYQEVTGRKLNIIYTTYDTNETMMTKVLKNDAGVDLICPSEYSIEKLLLANCLESQYEIYEEIKDSLPEGVTLSNMSSLKKGDGNIEPDVMAVIKDIFGNMEKDGKTYDMTEYMVPYMWGTLGILYNTKVVSEEELETYGWGVLWNVQKNEKLENKILMKDSVRDSYAAAVCYMYEYGLLPEGYENLSVTELINCTDQAVLDKAEIVLKEQREHISGYEVDFGKDDMLNEIVYADFAWSGDALWAIEESYDEDTDEYMLGYYVPPCASNIWYDGWCIPKSVQNKLGAMLFIDYMCKAESGVRNSVAIGYTSAVNHAVMQENEFVCEYLEENEYDVEEYFTNEDRYPEINESLGVMRDFGARNEALVQMWQRAKSGGVSPALGWVLLAIAIAAGIAVAVYFAVNALRFMPKTIKGSKEPKGEKHE